MHFQFKLSFFGGALSLYILSLSFVQTIFDPSLLNLSLILNVAHMEYIYRSFCFLRRLAGPRITRNSGTANKSKPCPFPAYLAPSWVPSLAPCYVCVWLRCTMYSTNWDSCAHHQYVYEWLGDSRLPAGQLDVYSNTHTHTPVTSPRSVLQHTGHWHPNLRLLDNILPASQYQRNDENLNTLYPYISLL